MKKPSVTQLVDMLDKPALLRWANRQGLAGIDIEAERKRTKAAGASLHEQIEKREFADPLHAFNFGRFLEKHELVRAEVPIETEWFVGRYDCLLRRDGHTYIADFKSCNTVYFETKLQLVAYAMAEPCERLAVVAIPDFRLIEAVVPDRSKYEDILVALARIYAARHEIERRPLI